MATPKGAKPVWRAAAAPVELEAAVPVVTVLVAAVVVAALPPTLLVAVAVLVLRVLVVYCEFKVWTTVFR